MLCILIRTPSLCPPSPDSVWFSFFVQTSKFLLPPHPQQNTELLLSVVQIWPNLINFCLPTTISEICKSCPSPGVNIKVKPGEYAATTELPPAGSLRRFLVCDVKIKYRAIRWYVFQKPGLDNTLCSRDTEHLKQRVWRRLQKTAAVLVLEKLWGLQFPSTDVLVCRCRTCIIFTRDGSIQLVLVHYWSKFQDRTS